MPFPSKQFLLPLFLSLSLCLFLSVKCTETKNTGQKTCKSDFDNFEEDFGRLVKKQKGRSEHKALAYANEDPTGCFAAGHSYGKSSRKAAIDAALSYCREYNPDQAYGTCTVYSVDGERPEE